MSERGHTPAWTSLVALLGALVLLLTGCPEAGDDDDDDTTAGDDDTVGDDDAGDDDAGDDDTGDDDTGDDDTGDDDMGDGSGSWTVTDATDCGPLRSAVYYDHYKDPWFGIFASSEPHTCADYDTASAAMDAADATWMAAYSAAEKAQDGGAACAAYQAYYAEIEVLDLAMRPPGSCTLEMYPADWIDGDYVVSLEKGTNLTMYGWYVVTVDSDYTGFVAYLTTACPGITSWSDWMDVLMDIWLHGGSSEHWDLSSGTVTFTTGSELGIVSQSPIAIEEFGLGADGTLELDLSAAHCEG